MDEEKHMQMNSPRRTSVPSSSLVLNSPHQVEEVDSPKNFSSSQPFVNRTFSEGEVPAAEEEIEICTEYSPSPVAVERTQVQPRVRPAAGKTPAKSGELTICFHISGTSVVNKSSEELWSKVPLDDQSKFYELMYKLAQKGTEASSTTMPGEDWKEYLSKEGAAIPVKKLRNIIPRMLMAAYHQEEDRQGKRKLKRLWEDKPEDWPLDVPFTDPNNGEKNAETKSRTKPKQQDLIAMYNHLRAKFTKGTVPFMEVDDKPIVSSSTMPSTDEIRSTNWFGKDTLERTLLKIQNAQAVLAESKKLKQVSVLAYMEDHLKRIDPGNVRRAALEVECLMDCITLNTAEFTDEFMQRKLSEFTCKYSGKSEGANTETKMKREVGVYHVTREMPVLKQEPLSPGAVEKSLGIKLSGRSGDVQYDQLIQSILGSDVVNTRPLPDSVDMDNAYELPKELSKLEEDSFADVNGGRVVVEEADHSDLAYLEKMLRDNNIDTMQEEAGRHPWDPPVKPPVSQAMPVPDTNLQTEHDVLDMVDQMFDEFQTVELSYSACNYNTVMPPMSQEVSMVQESLPPEIIVSEQKQDVPVEVPTSEANQPIDRATLQSLLGAIASGGLKLSEDDMTRLLKISGIPAVENMVVNFGGTSTASSCGSMQQVMSPVQVQSTPPTAVSITPVHSAPKMTNFTPQFMIPPSFTQGHFDGYSAAASPPAVGASVECTYVQDNMRNTMSPTSRDMSLIPTMVEFMAVSSDDDDDSTMPVAAKRMRVASKGKKGKMT